MSYSSSEETYTRIEEYAEKSFGDLENEVRKTMKTAGSQLEKIYHEHGRIAKKIELRVSDLKEHEELLEKRETKFQEETMMFYSEKKMYEREIMERKEAAERLAKEQQREKDNLHRRIVQLEKKLDAKKALELALKVYGEDSEVGLKDTMDEEVQHKNKMDATRRDLNDNIEHLESVNNILMAKERKSNDELQEARRALISGFADSHAFIRVRKMGELDSKPFQIAAKRLHKDEVAPEETTAKRDYKGETTAEKKAAKRKYQGQTADEKAVEWCSLWETYISDPSWHPFKVIPWKGDHKEVINEDDEALKTLRQELGDEVYEAVVTSLTEMNQYNPSGRCPVPELWHFKEGRKATLKEGVSHLLKQLRLYRRGRH